MSGIDFNPSLNTNLISEIGKEVKKDIDTENKVKENEAFQSKGSHGTDIDNVMRTTSAVYEGTWIMAQRELLANGGKLP